MVFLIIFLPTVLLLLIDIVVVSAFPSPSHCVCVCVGGGLHLLLSLVSFFPLDFLVLPMCARVYACVSNHVSPKLILGMVILHHYSVLHLLRQGLLLDLKFTNPG